MSKLSQLKKDLRSVSDKQCASELSRYFQVRPGGYGEGDVFIGLKVGDLRRVARKYRALPIADSSKLLDSRIHEERFVAMVIMDDQFASGNDAKKDELKKLYDDKMGAFNNWDLIDLSAPKVYGEWFRLRGKDPMPTFLRLAKSKNLWRRRIAMMSTAAFIRVGQFGPALTIAELLLHDSHDLIQKAVGWMLREVGNKDRASEEFFLMPRYKKMPRTALRYAIEKFPEPLRRAYLEGKV